MKKVGKPTLNLFLDKFRKILSNPITSISLIVAYVIILIIDCNFVYSQYIPNIYFQIPKYCIALAFVFKTLLIDWGTFNRRTQITLITIFALLVMQSLIGKDTTLVQIFMLSIGCYGVNFHKILKAILFSEGATLALIIILALIGIIPNWIYDRYEGGVVRQSLGLQYPTYIAIAATIFTTYYLYYRKTAIKLPEYIVLLIVNILCYIATDTRAMLVWSIITIVIFACLNNNIHKRLKLTKKLFKVTKYLLFVCAIVAIIPTIAYQPQNKTYARINHSLSNRLSLGKSAVNTYGIKIFGNNVEWIGSSLVHEGTNNGKKFNIVDSFYVRTLVAYGIVGFIIIMLAIEKTILRAQQEKNIYLVVVLSLLITQAILDQYITQVQWNIFALLFFQSFLPLRALSSKENYKSILKHKTKKKLSIILPVYNAQQYLESCIDQLEQIQNINYEIIIINDGSADQTPKIAKNLKNTYTNIIFVNNATNHGVSHARNIGIKKSNGDYIICVDVDDEINPTMYELLLKNASITKSDISMCDYYEITKNCKHISSKYGYQQKKLKHKEALKGYLLDRISNNVWDKMIKREVLSKITFNEQLHIGEDILYCLEIFNKANSTSQLPYELIGYVQNPASAMHNVSPKLTEYKNVIELIPQKICNNLQEKCPNEFSYFKLEMIVRGIHAISLSTNKHNYNTALELLSNYYTKNDLQNIVHNKNFSKMVRIEMELLTIFGPKVHLALIPFYRKIKELTR